MHVNPKSVDQNIRMLVELGDYAGAAEMADVNFPRGEIDDTTRRDAFKGIAHAALVNGENRVALDLLKKHGVELDDEAITSIIERVAADAPELIDELNATLVAHGEHPTAPLTKRT